jgi:hypothetical protein
MVEVSQLGDISHVIQLAIAPVFVLTAVCTLLAVLSGRLALAVDRRRILLYRLPELDAATAGTANGELDYLDRRVGQIYTAIALAVVAALLICLLIAFAFVAAFVGIERFTVIAVFFILAMLALIGSLGAFLREIFLAVHSVRTPII